MNTLDLAKEGPVIPVIVINRVEDAVPMAEALLEPRKSAALMKLAGKAETASHLTPEQANMARILATEAAQKMIKGATNE